MNSSSNIFSRLIKWATRQHENFLTESLAFVMQTLLDRELATGLKVLQALTGRFFSDLTTEDVLEIRTQVTIAEGRPDLELSTPNRIMIFEVKAEAEVRIGQLEGYRRYLNRCPHQHKALGLLTKYPVQFSFESEKPDYSIRWYEVADIIEVTLESPGIGDPIARYVAKSFLELLRERSMAVAQVGYQLADGARALHSLLFMIQEAATACGVSATKHLNLDYWGFMLDGKRFALGIWFEEPEKLSFSTESEFRLDLEAARNLSDGEIFDEGKRGQCWLRTRDLQSEEVHFFSRTKVGQIQWLEQFLQESINMIRPCELPLPR